MMLSNIDIKKEEAELYNAFEDCFAKVQGNAFYEDFAKEKIRHSMQVVGAGNYILKNEKVFQGRGEDYLKLGKLVNLFHDIGRFKEIDLLCKEPNSRHNHSYYSYEKLKDLGYTDLRLLLPVKLHGGLRAALDEDEEFQKITDERLATEVRQLYGLVKDADKIANLHLTKRDKRVFKDLFFSRLTQENKYAPVSENVLRSFTNRDLVKSSDCVSFSDRLLQILCFAFEIYYKSSFDFIFKHGLFENIKQIMRQYNPDKKQQKDIEKQLDDYVADTYRNL